MKTLRLAAGILLLAVPLLAGGLSKKHKEWPNSPDAYFLTADEREAWKRIQTDAEADKFISDYFARRGPDFRKMLDERIAVADKYFSAGGARGSETLRGKVIIVFGPPSKIEQKSGGGAVGVGEGTNPNIAADSAGRSGGGSGNPLTNVGPGAAGFATVDRVQPPVFSVIYDEAHAPKAIGKAFRAELFMDSAKSQRPVNPQQLDGFFEAVARASIQPPAAGAPSSPNPQ